MEINTRADIEVLVNSFYTKVNRDPLLMPVFAHVDWPEHLPVMYAFWSSILFGDQSYHGSPFQKHMSLPIGTPHFSRWLEFFLEAVDEHFSGEKAIEVKERAQHIANVFQFKMGLLK
jgi:hemoglobin